MRPIEFKEANVNLAKPEGMTDEECGPLPSFRDGKSCLSCWQSTWKERISILFYGKIWLWVMSGMTQPPVALDGKKSPFKAE